MKKSNYHPLKPALIPLARRWWEMRQAGLTLGEIAQTRPWRNESTISRTITLFEMYHREKPCS